MIKSVYQKLGLRLNLERGISPRFDKDIGLRGLKKGLKHREIRQINEIDSNVSTKESPRNNLLKTLRSFWRQRLPS